MELQKPFNENRNYFYPNCGCDNEDTCLSCPHCGMCVANSSNCACHSLPLGADAGLGYDPHREILGG